MDPESSQAAIEAIAALQARIRELEKIQRKIITDIESYKQKIQSRDRIVQNRTTQLEDATKKGKEMLEYIAGCDHDRSFARETNKKLKKMIQSVKDSFPRDDQHIIEDKTRKRQILKVDVIELNQRMSDYDVILSEYLMNQCSRYELDEELMKIAVDDDESLLESKYSNTYNELKGAPKEFKQLSLEDRRKIIKCLFRAVNQIRKIVKKMRKLERSEDESTDRNDFEAKWSNLAPQRILLLKEMGKFTFL